MDGIRRVRTGWVTEIEKETEVASWARPAGVYTDTQFELIKRQISLWETGGKDGSGLRDWMPNGAFLAPRGVRATGESLNSLVIKWHEEYTHLRIQLKSLFGSSDGRWLAIEWSWSATRKVDGASGVTPDAIVVELQDGKITRWQEYFDTFGSVEF